MALVIFLFVGLLILFDLKKSRIILAYFGFATVVFYLAPLVYVSYYSSTGLFWKVNPAIVHYELILVFIYYLLVRMVWRICSRTRTIAINPIPRKVHIRLMVWSMVLFSLTAKVYLLSRGLYSTEDVYNKAYLNIPRWIIFIRNLDLWAFFIILSVDRAVYRSTKTHSFIVFLLLIEIVIFSVIQGRRSGLLIPIILLLFVYSKYYNLSNFRAISGIIFGIAGLFALTVRRLVLAGIPLTKVTTALGAALFARIGSPAFMLNLTMSVSKRAEESSFLLALEGLIPAFMYGQKRSLSIGNSFGKDMLLINNSNVKTGINPGWIGEGYYNSGVVGIVVAACIMGLLISSSSLFKRGGFAHRICEIFIIILVTSGYQMEIAASTNNMIKGVLYLVVLSTVVFKLKINAKKH